VVDDNRQYRNAAQAVDVRPVEYVLRLGGPLGWRGGQYCHE